MTLAMIRSEKQAQPSVGRLGLVAAFAMLLAAVCLATSVTAASVVDGKGLIIEKNIDSSSLKLHTGVVLKVTETTKISDQHGKRIGIGDLVVTSSEGGVHANGEAFVRYSGRAGSKGVTAYSIQVVGHYPH